MVAVPSQRGASGLILDAYRLGGQLWVWCDHEQRWHHHGGCTGRCGRGLWSQAACTCPPGSADGLRSPHCVCQVARALPYHLREVGPLTAEVRAAMGRELSASRSCTWDDCRFTRAARRRTCTRRYRRRPS